jgi:hypothetical protein
MLATMAKLLASTAFQHLKRVVVLLNILLAFIAIYFILKKIINIALF